MALFSDIDWVILLGVAAFLLLGRENATILRTLGRYYGRAMRLKQELLSEFTQAAELPPPTAARPLSLRQTLLGDEILGSPGSGIPIAVTTPPVAVARPSVEPFPSTGPFAPGVWSIAVPVDGIERREVK